MIKFFYVLPLVLFNSCAYLIFPHKSFVSSPEDPLLIKKKHDIQTSISIKPFKFYEGNFNYGLTNHLALRFKAGGFVDLLNFNTSVLYFNNINKINFFFGPSFGYQSNQIKRRIGDGTFVREYQYSCLYYSPGLLLGLSLFRGNSVEHYFTIKSQYNIVDKYEYFYKEEDRYTGYQNESLKYNIPNFYNCEPTYTILFKATENPYLQYKLQIAYNYTQTSFVHNYTTGNTRTFYGYPYVLNKTYLHPASRVISFSAGIIFNFNFKN